MTILICSVCLGALNLKDDKIHSTNCGHIFHLTCLSESLRTQSRQCCPSCRQDNVQHFQLFFETEDDVKGARCNPSSSNEATRAQLGVIINKLDNLSQRVLSMGFNGPLSIQAATSMPANNEMCAQLLSQIEKLQKENTDLKEIHEMEEIVLANTEKEITELKEEIRQRNDIINSIQLQNDNLRDEVKLLNEPAVRENLINLL